MFIQINLNIFTRLLQVVYWSECARMRSDQFSFFANFVDQKCAEYFYDNAIIVVRRQESK